MQHDEDRRRDDVEALERQGQVEDWEADRLSSRSLRCVVPPTATARETISVTRKKYWVASRLAASFAALSRSLRPVDRACIASAAIQIPALVVE